jgi:hypothetical protein
MLSKTHRRQALCRSDLEFLRALPALVLFIVLLALGSSASAQRGVGPDEPGDPGVGDPGVGDPGVGGAVTGTMFLDRNGNGVLDVGERPIDGLVMELRSSIHIDTALTDDDGRFVFEGLEPDETYSLRPIEIDHLDVIPPDTRIVRLRAEQAVVDVAFPILRPCRNGIAQSVSHMGGVNDNYGTANREPTSPGSGLQASRPSCDGRWAPFDFNGCDYCFGHTFRDIKPDDCFVMAARLTIRMRANHGCGTLESNDTISLGTGGVTSWGRRIEHLLSGTWYAGRDETIVLNLAALPGPGTGTTSMIGALASGSLDVFVQDDTAVDYIKLDVTYCCPPDFSGHKYEDMNGNGVWDTGEPAVANWVINIVPPSGLGVGVQTDANGYWSYNATAAGTYTISEGSQVGWQQTAPSTGSYSVNWVPGQLHHNLDFGNIRVCDDPETVVVRGGAPDGFDSTNDEPNFHNDQLADKLENCGTSPISSFDVIPCNQCFGHTLATQIRPECVVVGGRLILRIRGGDGCGVQNDAIGFVQGGSTVWYQSLANLSTSASWGAGSDETFTFDLANLLASGAGVTNVLSHLQDGELSFYVQDDSGVDFARLELDYCCPCFPGTICGTKFDDINGNGVRDAGEPGIPGWNIDLVGPTAAFTVTTDANGIYCVDDLPPGQYIVSEVQQNGWAQTYPSSVFHTIDICSRDDLDRVFRADFGNIRSCEQPEVAACRAGREDGFMTVDGPEATTPSPALLTVMQLCSAGPQLVFDDMTSNRCFGHTFKRCWRRGCVVVGARLTMRIRANAHLASNDTISFRDGAASAWNYSVQTLAGTSWTTSATTVLSLDLANLPADGNNVTNVLALFQDGDLDVFIQDDTSVDYMTLEIEYCCYGSISGQKFEDLNQNGVKDTGEPGLANWDIELRDNVGTLLATDTTDATGDYGFIMLTNGNYYVSEVQQAGWVQTAPGSVYHTVNLVGGTAYPNRDFGNKLACEEDRTSELCSVGDPDNFDASTPESTSPSAILLGYMATVSGGASTQLDVLPTDRAVGHTFDECWSRDCCVVSARLCLTVRGGPSLLAYNDTIHLFNGATGLWGMRISTLVGHAWGPGQTEEICLDLANLPPNVLGVTNILASLQDGELGIMVQDDTGIDSMTLEVELCCPCKDDDSGIVHTTWEAPCCNGLATVAVVISNPTSTTQTYDWTIGGLPAGSLSGHCDLPGPSVFTPSAGTLTVPAGGTASATVQISCDATLASGYSCFLVHAINTVTGCEIISSMPLDDGSGAIGSVVHSPEIKGEVDELVVELVDGASTNVGFQLTNLGRATRVVEIQVESMASDHGRYVSLDGLPPGEAVVRTIELPPGRAVPIGVEASLAIDCDCFVFYDIILMVDIDGDGDNDAIASVATYRVASDSGKTFIRGDANGDGGSDLGDAVFTFSFLFLGGRSPSCMESADVNNDGNVDVGDGISLLSYQFRGGRPPAAPFPFCGMDPDGTPDGPSLSCDSYSPCD